ncbi:hypothetical protein ANCCAN_01190 [Ancylostoma caninum]|uniref:C-type lectin domain-containing protein n=1 Tax=Ancylostoma caninum TaxID=29170 RepID=A0A368H879_ANCCA|nr:hypothetical protein ANCCAN_01190 [Ancylostoma caninum]
MVETASNFRFKHFDRVNLTNFFECSLGTSIESQQEAAFVRGILHYFDGQLLGCNQPSNREYLVGRIFVGKDGSKSWSNCNAATYFRDKNDIKWKLGSNYLFIQPDGWAVADSADSCFYLCKEPRRSLS